MSELWLPDSIDTGIERRLLPDERKQDGGSYFDDELMTVTEHEKLFREQMAELIRHLNARPDHAVYVGSTDERRQLREVFNWWQRERIIGHHPNIRIDYGIAEGNIRVGEDR